MRPLPAAALLVVLTAFGCRSGEDTATTTARPPNGGVAAPGQSRSAGDARDGDDLERHYVIGPRAAQELGYRIDWQAPVLTGSGQVAIVAPQHDSVFVLDDRNYLTRLQRSDGSRLWRIAAANLGEEVLGITFIPEADRVYLTTGGSIRVLDAVTGSTVGRQRLEKIANTEPVVFEPYFIYGARNGELVWHAYSVGYMWRGFQVSRTIQIKPVLSDGVAVAIGNAGRIAGLSAETASGLWGKQLLDEVVARPAAGGGVVYVAATDQYLYGIDIRSGRTLWSRLTTAPLVSGPTLLGDRVYQQIPGEGLTAFEARPLDSPDGRIVWTAPEVTGSVVLSSRDRLFAWDSATRRMALLNRQNGGMVSTVRLPQVDMLMPAELEDPNIIAIARDGRVQRLVPR